MSKMDWGSSLRWVAITLTNEIMQLQQDSILTQGVREGGYLADHNWEGGYLTDHKTI